MFRFKLIQYVALVVTSVPATILRLKIQTSRAILSVQCVVSACVVSACVVSACHGFHLLVSVCHGFQFHFLYQCVTGCSVGHWYSSRVVNQSCSESLLFCFLHFVFSCASRRLIFYIYQCLFTSNITQTNLLSIFSLLLTRRNTSTLYILSISNKTKLMFSLFSLLLTSKLIFSFFSLSLITI